MCTWIPKVCKIMAAGLRGFGPLFTYSWGPGMEFLMQYPGVTFDNSLGRLRNSQGPSHLHVHGSSLVASPGFRWARAQE